MKKFFFVFTVHPLYEEMTSLATFNVILGFTLCVQTSFVVASIIGTKGVTKGSFPSNNIMEKNTIAACL